MTIEEHPCPIPKRPNNHWRDGDLWGCRCGKVYVLRHESRYGDRGWTWYLTDLTFEDDFRE